MPRVPIASENRTGEGGDRFPKVKLQEKGEKTRFTIIEEPWREYVHYLKAPTFDDHGRPVKETKQRRDKTEYQDYKLEFVGSPICLGDEDALKASGLDPKNCPACEASEKSGGDIPGPIQRFAVTVIEHALRGNTWEIKKPYSAEIKIWAFTGRIYDEIEGIQQEIGDLRKHDISLECEDAYWQRNKLGFKMEPGYRDAPQGYIKELLGTPGNRPTDQQLKDACGRDVPRQRMQDDCDHVMRQWRKLRTEGGEGGYDTSTGADLAGGIDALLGEEGGSTGEAAASGFTGGDDPFAEFAGETETPAQEKPAKAKAGASASAGASTGQARAAKSSTARPSEPADEDQLPFDMPEGETAAAVDEFLDSPETGTARERPAKAAEPKEEPAAPPADDFDFDDLMEGIG